MDVYRVPLSERMRWLEALTDYCIRRGWYAFKSRHNGNVSVHQIGREEFLLTTQQCAMAISNARRFRAECERKSSRLRKMTKREQSKIIAFTKELNEEAIRMRA